MPQATMQTPENEHQGTIACILELAYALAEAEEIGDDDAIDSARTSILEDPLDIQTRSEWHTPGEKIKDSEYFILISTGGPAYRIIGTLDNGQPETARLEHQDWGTPWTKVPLSDEEQSAFLAYANCFYFGE